MRIRDLASVLAASAVVPLRNLPKVDVALLPFWYLLDADSRRFVADAIGPRRIVAMHLPPADAADFTRRLRSAGVNVVLPPQPGSAIR